MSAPERREQLLDVTTALALARGFHDVSIEAVAREAGITRALVYQHFGDLPSLLEAVVGREMSRALSQVSVTTLPDLREGDPRELMIDSLRAFLRAVRDHPRTWRLVRVPWREEAYASERIFIHPPAVSINKIRCIITFNPDR